MVPGPHDALFKFVFSQPEHAASELRAVLPVALSTRLDWNSLVPIPASFVDERLKDRHADLLFSVRCQGRNALLYLLLEHQSSSDSLMPFRLLRYVVRVWDAFLQQNPGARRLPAVIPVVIHHSDSEWSAPTRLSALIDLDATTLEAVSALIPDFAFVLDDLTAADDDALRARSHSAVVTAGLLLLGRARTSPDLAVDLTRWFDLLARIAASPNGVAALAALLQYALQVGEISPDDLNQLVHQLGPEAVEAHMTGMQRLTEKVREEALAEGKAEGKAELIVRLIGLRFGPLPSPAAQRIRRASVPELDLWAERVLTANSLDDVLR